MYGSLMGAVAIDSDAFDSCAQGHVRVRRSSFPGNARPQMNEATTMYRYPNLHGNMANPVRRCPFGHPSCDYPIQPIEEGLVAGPHHYWNHLVDVPVEIRRNDKYVRSGIIEEVTADSTIAWLAAEGASTRLLIDKNDGYEIWTYFCIDVSEV